MAIANRISQSQYAQMQQNPSLVNLQPMMFENAPMTLPFTAPAQPNYGSSRPMTAPQPQQQNPYSTPYTGMIGGWSQGAVGQPGAFENQQAYDWNRQYLSGGGGFHGGGSGGRQVSSGGGSNNMTPQQQQQQFLNDVLGSYNSAQGNYQNAVRDRELRALQGMYNAFGGYNQGLQQLMGALNQGYGNQYQDVMGRLNQLGQSIPQAYGQLGDAMMNQQQQVNNQSLGTLMNRANQVVGAQGQLADDLYGLFGQRAANTLGTQNDLYDLLSSGQENRYQNVTGGQQQLRGDVRQGYQDRAATATSAQNQLGSDVNTGYQNRTATISGLVKDIGKQREKDIQEDYDRMQARNTQNMVDRGLTGTTILPTMSALVDRERNSALDRLYEQMAGLQANTLANLTGDQLTAQERLGQRGVDLGAMLSGDTLAADERLGQRDIDFRAALLGDDLNQRERVGQTGVQLGAALTGDQLSAYGNARQNMVGQLQDLLGDIANSQYQMGSNLTDLGSRLYGQQIGASQNLGLAGAQAAGDLAGGALGALAGVGFPGLGNAAQMLSGIGSEINATQEMPPDLQGALALMQAAGAGGVGQQPSPFQNPSVPGGGMGGGVMPISGGAPFGTIGQGLPGFPQGGFGGQFGGQAGGSGMAGSGGGSGSMGGGQSGGGGNPFVVPGSQQAWGQPLPTGSAGRNEARKRLSEQLEVPSNEITDKMIDDYIAGRPISGPPTQAQRDAQDPLGLGQYASQLGAMFADPSLAWQALQQIPGFLGDIGLQDPILAMQARQNWNGF